MKNKNKNYKYEQKRPMSTAKKWLIGIVTTLLLVGCVGGITYGVMANLPKEETPPVEQTTPPVTEDSSTTETPTTPVEPIEERILPFNFTVDYEGTILDSVEIDLNDLTGDLSKINSISLEKNPHYNEGTVLPYQLDFGYYLNSQVYNPVPHNSYPSSNNVKVFKINDTYIQFTAYEFFDGMVSFSFFYSNNPEYMDAINSDNSPIIDATSIDFVVKLEVLNE